MKKAEFKNCVDPDEAAHNELPHLDLRCFPYSFEFSISFSLDKIFF